MMPRGGARGGRGGRGGGGRGAGRKQDAWARKWAESTEGNQFTCSLCNNVYHRTDNFARHLEQQHGVDEKSSVPCFQSCIAALALITSLAGLLDGGAARRLRSSPGDTAPPTKRANLEPSPPLPTAPSLEVQGGPSTSPPHACQSTERDLADLNSQEFGEYLDRQAEIARNYDVREVTIPSEPRSSQQQVEYAGTEDRESRAMVSSEARTMQYGEHASERNAMAEAEAYDEIAFCHTKAAFHYASAAEARQNALRARKAAGRL